MLARFELRARLFDKRPNQQGPFPKFELELVTIFNRLSESFYAAIAWQARDTSKVGNRCFDTLSQVSLGHTYYHLIIWCSTANLGEGVFQFVNVLLAQRSICETGNGFLCAMSINPDSGP